MPTTWNPWLLVLNSIVLSALRRSSSSLAAWNSLFSTRFLSDLSYSLKAWPGTFSSRNCDRVVFMKSRSSTCMLSNVSKKSWTTTKFTVPGSRSGAPITWYGTVVTPSAQRSSFGRDSISITGSAGASAKL